MKLVILDRDGVINVDSDDYIKSVEEWQPLPGSAEAIARLSLGGFSVIVATNQSGIGRGLFDLDALEAMHDKMRHCVESAGGHIDAIYYCPHHPDDQCGCRKPAPGLLDAIRNDYGLAGLADIPVIGDSIRDLKSAVSRGCLPILVRTGKGLKSLSSLPEEPDLQDTLVFDDLAAVADYLLDYQ